MLPVLLYYFYQIVELVFVNIDTATCHPFHLHGFNYRVVAQGKIKDISMEKIRDMNENGNVFLLD